MSIGVPFEDKTNVKRFGEEGLAALNLGCDFIGFDLSSWTHFQNLLKKLLYIQTWDLIGSCRPSPAATEKALDRLTAYIEKGIRLPCKIVTTCNGGIQMEWCDSSSLLEIKSDGKLSYSDVRSKVMLGCEV